MKFWMLNDLLHDIFIIDELFCIYLIKEVISFNFLNYSSDSQNYCCLNGNNNKKHKGGHYIKKNKTIYLIFKVFF